MACMVSITLPYKSKALGAGFRLALGRMGQQLSLAAGELFFNLT
jgi:hypothetical protein